MNDYEKIFGLIFSFTVMTIGALRIAERRKLMKIGIRTEGIVASINKIITRNRLTFYHIINFETISGEKISLSLKDGMPFPVYGAGNKIILMYNKDNPKKIVVVSKVVAMIEFFISIVGALGLIFFMQMFLFNK